MKTRIVFLCGMLLFSGGLFSEKSLQNNDQSSTTLLVVYCSPDLKQLTTTWAEEYMKATGELQIEVREVEAELAAMPASGALIFTSYTPDVAGSEDMTWRITVGRDVIVPVFNAKNPNLAEITGKGITTDALLRVFRDPIAQNWGTLAGNGDDKPVRIYLTKEEKVIDGVKNFIGIDAIMPVAITISDKDEVIRSIQNDTYAMGFCRLADIINGENKGLMENILLLPIDRNQNGKVDYIENIYSDLNMFARGVWIGKYPRSLYSDIQIISDQQPTGAAQTTFLNWILTSGQPYLALNGLSDLAYSERQSRLDKINSVTVTFPPVERVNSVPKLVFLISLAILFAGLTLGTVIRFSRGRSTPLQEVPKNGPGVFDENSISVPKGLYFSRSHTWAFMEKDGFVKIGIDDFLQHVTGRITRVDLKQPGDIIKRGETLVSIAHKGKQLNIYSPVNGTIRDYNRSLSNHADLINSSPYAEGWIYLVEPVNWAHETRILSMADNYIKWLYEEFTRLKDFLAINLNTDRLKYSRIVLQDGGMLKDNVLEDLGPEVWEDFQTDFLDPSR